MASDAKKRRIDCGADAVDRISNLPRNLIDHIRDCLPLYDAARTSILSKTWRNVWVTHQNLVFDKAFMSQLISKKDEQDRLSEVLTTISNILLVHSGPILKFYLFIPRDLPLCQSLAIDCWIKNISNNGVRILELRNNLAIPYKLPSYLFSCLKLTHLSLGNCILNAPLNFGGFPNLISVVLWEVTIIADMSFGTQLEKLYLRRCTGLKHLGWQFNDNNNVSKLMISESVEIDWQWFQCTKKVQDFGLALKGTENSRKNLINLDKLLGNMPRIYSLHLDGYFLEFLEPGSAIMKRLITTENMNTLHLSHVRFYKSVQIQYVLYLIRSSPKLQKLHVTLEPDGRNFNEKALDELFAGVNAMKYLQSPNFVGMILGQLKTVDIQHIVGSKAELCFIKFLLASSPSLRWMKLSNSTTINDPEKQLRNLQELIQFPRASPVAQIICT